MTPLTTTLLSDAIVLVNQGLLIEPALVPIPAGEALVCSQLPLPPTCLQGILGVVVLEKGHALGRLAWEGETSLLIFSDFVPGADAATSGMAGAHLGTPAAVAAPRAKASPRSPQPHPTPRALAPAGRCSSRCQRDFLV